MIESKLKAKNCNRGQLFRAFWLSSALTGSIFVCGPLHHHVTLSSIFWGRRSFQIRYAAHF